MSCIIYLHGFLSSPQSEKAQLTVSYFKAHYPEIKLVVPALPNTPDQLRPVMERLITDHQLAVGEGVKVIGSSMGGYLASWLVETCGGKAVLINPAVTPFILLQDYLGDHINPYTQEHFSLRQQDMATIAELDTPNIRVAKDYKVLLQTGDETLDYRQAEKKYAGGDVVIEQGGDHGFQDYAAHLPAIAKFLLG